MKTYQSTLDPLFSLTCCLLLRFELNASYQTELSITHQTVFPLTKAANLGSCLAKDLILRMNGHCVIHDLNVFHEVWVWSVKV